MNDVLVVQKKRAERYRCCPGMILTMPISEALMANALPPWLIVALADCFTLTRMDFRFTFFVWDDERFIGITSYFFVLPGLPFLCCSFMI